MGQQTQTPIFVLSIMDDGATRIASDGEHELTPPDRDRLIVIINSHADLLAACEAMLPLIERWEPTTSEEVEAIKSARAAIAAVRQQPV